MTSIKFQLRGLELFECVCAPAECKGDVRQFDVMDVYNCVYNKITGMLDKKIVSVAVNGSPHSLVRMSQCSEIVGYLTHLERTVADIREIVFDFAPSSLAGFGKFYVPDNETWMEVSVRNLIYGELI